eukprot:2061921-Amphidinium_carterae.1
MTQSMTQSMNPKSKQCNDTRLVIYRKPFQTLVLCEKGKVKSQDQNADHKTSPALDAFSKELTDSFTEDFRSVVLQWLKSAMEQDSVTLCVVLPHHRQYIHSSFSHTKSKPLHNTKRSCSRANKI